MGIFQNLYRLLETIWSPAARLAIAKQQAVELLQNGHASEAEGIYRKLLLSNHHDVELHRKLVFSLLFQNRLRDAKKYMLDSGVEASEFQFEKQIIQGLRKQQLSQKALLKWIKIDEDDEDRLEKLLKMRKKYSSWTGLITTILKLAQSEGNFEAYSETLSYLMGTNPPAEFADISSFYYQRERWYLQSHPELQALFQSLVGSDIKSKKRKLKSVQSLYADSFLLQFELGSAYFEEKDYQKSMFHLRLATSLNPVHLHSWNLLYVSALHLDSFEKAYEILNSVPYQPEWMDSHIRSLQSIQASYPFLAPMEEGIRRMGLGDFATAINHFQEAVHFHPSSPHLLYLLAKAHVKQENFFDALLVYDELLQIESFEDSFPVVQKKWNECFYRFLAFGLEKRKVGLFRKRVKRSFQFRPTQLEGELEHLEMWEKETVSFELLKAYWQADISIGLPLFDRIRLFEEAFNNEYAPNIFFEYMMLKLEGKTLSKMELEAWQQEHEAKLTKADWFHLSVFYSQMNEVELAKNAIVKGLTTKEGEPFFDEKMRENFVKINNGNQVEFRVTLPRLNS